MSLLTHIFAHQFKRTLAVAIGLPLLSTLLATALWAEDGIKPYPGNPWYWSYEGEPVVLIGGSNNDNLFQSPDVVAELDALQDVGGNYVRCTLSSSDEGDLWPFAQLPDDSYDLNTFNPEYWDRLDRFLAATAERGIFVQIELWATFSFYRDNWARNPFNPRNNHNLTPRRVRLPEVVDSHPVRRENPFFWSVPEMDNNTQLLAYQQKFVDRVLEASWAYDHVLYCIDNETSVTASWALFWARYLHQEAELEGKDIYVTEMWDPHDLGHASHRVNLMYPEVFTFLDISQNNHLTGHAHYEGALNFRHRADVLVGPRPLTSVKIYGAQRFGTPRDAVERFWRNIFAGLSAARFHRPTAGLGLSELSMQHLRSMRFLLDSVEVTRLHPAPTAILNEYRGNAYAMQSVNGATTLVYIPQGGARKLSLPVSAAAPIQLRWLRVTDTAWQAGEVTSGSDALTLEIPDPAEDWVAWLTPAPAASDPAR